MESTVFPEPISTAKSRDSGITHVTHVTHSYPRRDGKNRQNFPGPLMGTGVKCVTRKHHLPLATLDELFSRQP